MANAANVNADGATLGEPSSLSVRQCMSVRLAESTLSPSMGRRVAAWRSPHSRIRSPSLSWPDGHPMASRWPTILTQHKPPMLQDPSEMGVVRLVSQCYALSFAADVSLDVTLVGKGETRDGKNYMSLEDVKVVLMPGQLISQVENLFNGNKELSKFA